MRVISRSRLRDFWLGRNDDAKRAERELAAWYKLAKQADWKNFAELKGTFPSTDQVGNCAVFDVGNNRYRLIGRVIYAKRRLYVLKVMDHAEYDRNHWPDDCGCHRPPPRLRTPRKIR